MSPSTGPVPPLLIAGDPSRFTKGQEAFPRIEMAVGRDYYSGGLTLASYVLDERGLAVGKRLFVKRWNDKPQSVEECVWVAYRGLEAYMREAGIAFG